MLTAPSRSTNARRHFLAALTAAAFALLTAAAPSTAQAYDGWVYREDLGGWLDENTGLVWGVSAGDAYGGVWTWKGANNVYLPRYRADTGINAWRLPTPDELQDAYLKGASGVLVPAPDPVTGSYGNHRFFWSSQTKGKKSAWLADWILGGVFYSSQTRSYANAIAVYRAY